MSDSSVMVARLIRTFRAGDVEAGNELLKRYRPWLRLLARLQIDPQLDRRFDASDIVQQTMLEAVRDFPQFQGNTEAEFTAWLRQVLGHALGHELHRHRGAAKRHVGREISIDQQLAESSQRLRSCLATSDTSPSDNAERHEQELLLAEVLERLPVDYRDVIVLRNLQGLSHEQIADRMNRNVGAVRMLWVRALAMLKKQIVSKDS
ncbi:MAG: sigma-70 family RNA polymerase sigma factor [Fuerstiella sp.]